MLNTYPVDNLKLDQVRRIFPVAQVEHWFKAMYTHERCQLAQK